MMFRLSLGLVMPAAQLQAGTTQDVFCTETTVRTSDKPQKGTGGWNQSAVSSFMGY